MISDEVIDTALQWVEVEVVTRNIDPLCLDCLAIALSRRLVLFVEPWLPTDIETLRDLVQEAAEQAVDLTLRVGEKVKHR